MNARTPAGILAAGVKAMRNDPWWETVANFVADTYLTSPLCADARNRHQQREGRTIIELNRVIGDSHQVIVDATAGTGNYYQAWPFLTYLTNNPDRYPGLGATVLRDMFRKHMRDNETPLHVLERIAAPTRVQKIVGRPASILRREHHPSDRHGFGDGPRDEQRAVDCNLGRAC